MNNSIDALRAEVLNQLNDASTLQQLDAWHSAVLARKGSLTNLLGTIGALPREERPAFGQAANDLKRELEAAYEAKLADLKAHALRDSLQAERVDVTLPGRPVAPGRLHLSTQTLRDVYRIFGLMGFQVYRAREVETDEYNFQLLNIPPHHPARDMQDTLYTTGAGVILRTQRSSPSTKTGILVASTKFTKSSLNSLAALMRACSSSFVACSSAWAVRSSSLGPSSSAFVELTCSLAVRNSRADCSP